MDVGEDGGDALQGQRVGSRDVRQRRRERRAPDAERAERELDRDGTVRDPSEARLTDLSREPRGQFLIEQTIIGDPLPLVDAVDEAIESRALGKDWAGDVNRRGRPPVGKPVASGTRSTDGGNLGDAGEGQSELEAARGRGREVTTGRKVRR